MNGFKKLGLLILTLSCLICFVYVGKKTKSTSDLFKPKAMISNIVQHEESSMFYILMWTDDKTVPFVYLKHGDEIFKESMCEYSNCYITKDKSYLSDITEFDAVIFHAPEFTYSSRYRKPRKRLSHQRYIFTCIESAENYPVCKDDYNNFFNWTWTYRTTSEAKWGYVDIKDMEGNIIGPRANIPWITNMTDVSDETLSILKHKTKAVMWLVSNCYTESKRENYAKQLGEHLKKYNLNIDVYGECGTLKCKDTEECHALIKRDYHFYLSFENSFAEDYVTEKFLHALSNYAVPIVWGGADYSRFAPPKTYLNAREIDPSEMAKMINALIQNPVEYASYFKWRNHYKYQRDIETPDTRAPCTLCKALNKGKDDESNNKYADFKAWWNAGIKPRCWW